MAEKLENSSGSAGVSLRLAAWSAAALILLLSLVAMQFTDEVNWSTADFAFAAGLMLAVGISFELTVRKTADPAYRAAIGVALAAAFLLVWLSFGVGIIGADGDPANLMYIAVLAVGIVGALAARFQPRGMARTMLAAALAQALVAVIALIARLGYPYSGPLEIVGLNGFFVALFIGSASLFMRAAQTNRSA